MIFDLILIHLSKMIYNLHFLADRSVRLSEVLFAVSFMYLSVCLLSCLLFICLFVCPSHHFISLSFFVIVSIFKIQFLTPSGGSMTQLSIWLLLVWATQMTTTLVYSGSNEGQFWPKRYKTDHEIFQWQATPPISMVFLHSSWAVGRILCWLIP